MVVPPPSPAAVAAPGAAPTCHSLPPDKDAPLRPPTHRCGYIPWHVLMRRGLNLDVETCPRCGGKMRLVALVQEPENIARYLRHLGLPTEVPPMAPLSGLGPARPAPAPRGFAAPVACPWATVLAEPRPPPPPRSATRHGSNVAGARHRRSDRLPPARPLATGQAPVCPETRNPFRWPSMASVFRPDPPAPPHLPASIVSSPRHPTGPEGVYFSYGPGEAIRSTPHRCARICRCAWPRSPCFAGRLSRCLRFPAPVP